VKPIVQDNSPEVSGKSVHDNAEVVELILIDDAADLRGILRRLMERSGLIRVVGEANGAEEASQLINAHEPDVILLDLAMPGGGALELIERLRIERQGMTIIVLSGYPTSTTAHECIERGADRYLEKGKPTSKLISEILEAHSIRKGLL